MDKKYSVTFIPQGITIRAASGATVLEAARQHNLALEGPCNGTGTCGKCLVKVTGPASEPTEEEKKKLGPKLEEGWRLACRTGILGDLTVNLAEKQVFQALESGRAKEYPFDPPGGSMFALPAYGIAVDIGTTSLVAALVDLTDTGAELAVLGCLNPQTQFGGDVITRITHAHLGPDQLKQLQEAVTNGINSLAADLCQKTEAEPEQIARIVLAGNTTMLHLLAGVDPYPLAVAPYEPLFVDYREHPAAELGLTLASRATAGLLPSLSAFVGADILAGILAADFHRIPVPALFIDIGTNGEIVANVNGKLAATSSAAGPALEGMNIQCGCRAEAGAISGIQISPAGELALEIIGSYGAEAMNNTSGVKHPLRGLCGSGLVELVSELVRTGVILPSGRLAESERLPAPLAARLIEFEGQRAFLIDPGGPIVLTQRDIRQVQLAKAAIAAAIEILYKRLGVSLNTVEKVYIAGAFGFHLKPEALKTIGLLPPELRGEIEFIGNTAKEGARLCLTSKAALEEIQALQKAITPVELSYAADFMDNYVEQMNFPTE